MNIVQIRKELQNGKSIEEVCNNHKISFKELCAACHGYVRKEINKDNFQSKDGEKYIFCRNNRYAVKKHVRGKGRIFGTYNSLEDAILVRDALIKDGWHQTHVDRICSEVGVIRRSGHKNEHVRYH